MKKKFKIMIGLGLALGVILLVLQNVLKIDPSTLMDYYLKFGVVLILLILIVNTVYFVIMSSKIKKKLVLYHEGKYGEFNSAMEEILKKAKGENLKNIIRINLSAGYIESKEYDKAKETLENIKPLKLRDERVRLVYYINLCVCNFKLENYEKFKELYEINKNLFKKYKDEEGYSESLAQLEITNYIVEEEFDKARELLEVTREKYKDTKYKDDYNELEKQIKENSEIRN